MCSGSLCGTTSHRDGEASALNQQLHSCTRVHAVEGPDKTCMARLFVRPLILGSASPRSLAVTSPERLLPYLGEALHEWWRWQAGSFIQERSRTWRYMLMWPACWSKEMYTVHTGRRRALIKEREGARAREGTRCMLDKRGKRSGRNLLSWVLSKVWFCSWCWNLYVAFDYISVFAHESQLVGVGISPRTFTVLCKMQKEIVELLNWLIPG